ncbi:MAG: hypothetical protein ABI844_09720 [Saprospiraceae bacterium]
MKLCVARLCIKFSGGRQFSASIPIAIGTPTSCSCEPLPATIDDSMQTRNDLKIRIDKSNK